MYLIQAIYHANRNGRARNSRLQIQRFYILEVQCPVFQADLFDEDETENLDYVGAI